MAIQLKLDVDSKQGNRIEAIKLIIIICQLEL